MQRKGQRNWRTSSTSGSILMFGSMLRTRSWIDRRMLASPGVDLRREDVSSVAHVSSLGFFSADGVFITLKTEINQWKRNRGLNYLVP
jgi:hypothetical protein